MSRKNYEIAEIEAIAVKFQEELKKKLWSAHGQFEKFHDKYKETQKYFLGLSKSPTFLDSRLNGPVYADGLSSYGAFYGNLKGKSCLPAFGSLLAILDYGVMRLPNSAPSYTEICEKFIWQFKNTRLQGIKLNLPYTRELVSLCKDHFERLAAQRFLRHHNELFSELIKIASRKRI